MRGIFFKRFNPDTTARFMMRCNFTILVGTICFVLFRSANFELKSRTRWLMFYLSRLCIFRCGERGSLFFFWGHAYFFSHMHYLAWAVHSFTF